VSGVCPPFAALFPVGTPEQVAATSVTTASNGAVGVARSQTLVVTNTISDRVRAISRDLARSLAPSQNKPVGSSYRGIAAGSAGSGLSIWGDASGSFLGNSTAAAGYHGTSVVALAGADYILDPQWIVGFSAGYTHDNITFSSVRGNSTADGALLGPYASYILGPNLSLDAQFTYTCLSNNISSVAPTPVGEFDGNRLTGAANLNAFTDFTPFTLIGFTGYAYTWQGNNIFLPNSVLPGLVSTPSSSSLILTNIRFGVFRLGGEAGYQMDQLEAYVPLTFEYQTTKPQDGAGRAALVVGAGLRYRWSDQLKGDIRATATEFETHIRDIKVEANLRWIF